MEWPDTILADEIFSMTFHEPEMRNDHLDSWQIYIVNQIVE